MNQIFRVPFAALLLTAVSGLSAATQPPAAVVDRVDWQTFLARHDLVWNSLPVGWDSGAPLGNGLLGTMIYSDKTSPLRWDIGRTDVTEHRGEPGKSPTATFERARLPIGHFTLQPVGKVQSGTMRLDLWNAEALGTLNTDHGSISWRSLVHASELAIFVELSTRDGERECRWQWEPEAARPTGSYASPKGYAPNPPTRLETQGEVRLCVQPLLVGGEYATAWREVKLDHDRRLLVVSVASSTTAQTASHDAVRAVNRAAAERFSTLVASHRQWWHAYYPESFVSIPDTRLESFYWIQMYKLASATRADRPALDLMGPWFRTTDWPAIWWNLNIQLAYYPVYTSNRLELGESLCRMLDDHTDNLIRNVKPEYQRDSAAIGRVTGYDCRGDVGGEAGNLTWACHNYWRQYRYSMDDERLRKKLYPLLRRCIGYYLHLLKPGPDGKLHLPETLSPEYGATTDCNYDLSLLRWGCETLLAICERLKIDDPLIPEWKKVLANLTDYPQGADGLWIGRNTPLAHSHRHYSHLLMIYPLHTMNFEQPENRFLIARSLDHWINLKGGLLGYSFSGAASISASIGRRDDAVRLLNTMLDRYVLPNTMYREESPVIETPLSGAETVHDLLIQSWGDTIRVFPGVPDSWQDVTFHHLRAEGGFLVSAARRGGSARWVRIESLVGEPCRIRADLFGDKPVRITSARGLEAKPLPNGKLELPLLKGEVAVFYSGDAPPEQVVEPVTAEAGRSNWYGSLKGRQPAR